MTGQPSACLIFCFSTYPDNLRLCISLVTSLLSISYLSLATSIIFHHAISHTYVYIYIPPQGRNALTVYFSAATHHINYINTVYIWYQSSELVKQQQTHRISGKKQFTLTQISRSYHRNYSGAKLRAAQWQGEQLNWPIRLVVQKSQGQPPFGWC